MIVVIDVMFFVSKHDSIQIREISIQIYRIIIRPSYEVIGDSAVVLEKIKINENGTVRTLERTYERYQLPFWMLIRNRLDSSTALNVSSSNV